MIKAVIFDLDNTLLDFMKMKEYAVKAAIAGMIEAGLDIDNEKSYNTIVSIYEKEGWENQQVFNYFLDKTVGEVNNKYLAAAIVAYRRAREANLLLYPNVNHSFHLGALQILKRYIFLLSLVLVQFSSQFFDFLK